MSARKPRFEVVRSDAGWFARFVAANGAKVWQTEVYVRRRGALRAIDMLTTAAVGSAATPSRIHMVDERTPPPPVRDITARAFGGWI